MNLEITTTACCRPSVYERTLFSFTDHVKNVNWKCSTLYINIDPTPQDLDPMKVVDLSKKYIGNVVYHIPKVASFPMALKWVWQQPKNKYFFHLEDDWLCIKDFTIEELTEYLSCFGDKAVRSAFSYTRSKKFVQVVPRAYAWKNKKVTLTPSIVDTKWAKKMASSMEENKNPEKKILHLSKTKYYAWHYPEEDEQVRYFRDLGRYWMIKNKYQRSGGPNSWVQWRSRA